MQRCVCTQASEGGFVTQQILNYKYLPVRTETVSNSEAEVRLDRKSRDSSAFWDHQQSSDQTISGIWIGPEPEISSSASLLMISSCACDISHPLSFSCRTFLPKTFSSTSGFLFPAVTAQSPNPHSFCTVEEVGKLFGVIELICEFFSFLHT